MDDDARRFFRALSRALIGHAEACILSIPVLFLFMWALRYPITGPIGGSVKG